MRYIRIAAVLLFAGSLIAFLVTDRMVRADVDTIPPVIVSEASELELSVKDGAEQVRKGITVTDNKDGDLTGELMVASHSKFIEKGVTNITYLVFDSSNNAAQYTRRVRYTDYESPVFSLTKPVLYPVGSSITILDRLKAEDALEGDISDKIRILSSNVNESAAGLYRIRAEVTNGYADTVTLEIPILLTEGKSGNAPEITLKEYLVYIKKGTRFDAASYLLSAQGEAGDLTKKVKVDSTVDTKECGTYLVTYSCTENGETGYSCLVAVVTE